MDKMQEQKYYLMAKKNFLTNIIKYYMKIVKPLIIEFNIDYLMGMAS